MKKSLYKFFVILMALSSCKDNNVDVFNKTADERVADAIADLKADLTAPANGFIVKYNPDKVVGSFYVLLKFNEDNSLIIQSDVAANKGEFVTDTLTYRIDSALGLQLIIENYSLFSYMFEQNNASFPAEYEFFYVSKNSDNSLVFKSKTDATDPTILNFEKASADDIALLGTTVANNLAIQGKDLKRFSSSLQLTYLNKDLIFYISLDNDTRRINFNSASKKSNTQASASVNFSSPYFLKGDSLVFDSKLSGSFLGNTVSIKGIKFNKLESANLNVCGGLPVHLYNGVTSSNDNITLETSLFDVTGANFQSGTFFDAPLNNISNNGNPASSSITQDIVGAVSMQLYYNYDIGSGSPFYAMGFRIINKNGTTTYALREFTPSLNGNNIVFNFSADISVFGSQQTDANINNINIYLDALTQGDQTYVFKYSEDIYEFYNPCTGWNVGFPVVN